MEIRRAEKKDIPGVIKLLYQVNQIHADGRKDLFKSGGIKYTEESLAEKFDKEDEYIYVALEGDTVLGYCFSVINVIEENTSLYPRKEWYIDDLCVDEVQRGKHIGKQLYEFVLKEAKRLGCYHVTLHVWECNDAAKKFYNSIGMKPMYYSMEQIL